MWICGGLALCLCVLGHASAKENGEGQEPKRPEGLAIEVVLPFADMRLPYEPVCAVVTVHNRSKEPVRIPGLWTDRIRCQFKPADDWQTIDHRTERASEFVPFDQAIGPGKSSSALFCISTVTVDGRALLEEGRMYDLRFVVAGFRSMDGKKKWTLVSDPIRAKVVARKNDEGLDAAITVLLGRKELERRPGALAERFLLYLDAGLLGKYPQLGDGRCFTQMEYFVTRFPQTRYSLYLRRTYALLASSQHLSAAKGIGRVEAEKITEQAEEYRAYLRKHAPFMLINTAASHDPKKDLISNLPKQRAGQK